MLFFGYLVFPWGTGKYRTLWQESCMSRGIMIAGLRLEGSDLVHGRIFRLRHARGDARPVDPGGSTGVMCHQEEADSG